MRRLLPALYGAALLSGAVPIVAAAQDRPEYTPGPRITRAPIGSSIVVSPGQEFYAQVHEEAFPAYRLERPIKSSMPGTMGLPFSFSIDADILIHAYKSPSGWHYYVPPDHKFSARHSLLGSVLRGGDCVGLRIGPQGQMEWFVDNSVYARRPTIWTRPVRLGDPAVKRSEVDVLTEGSLDRLLYLGVTAGNRAKIRFERTSGSHKSKDEFSFALDRNGRGAGAINGAEFAIEATALHATITVLKPMTSDIGTVAPPRARAIAEPPPAT